MCDFYDDDYDNNDHPDFERDFFSDPMPSEDSDKCQFCKLYAEYEVDGLKLCMCHYNSYTADMDAIHEELVQRRYKNRVRSQPYFRL